MSIVSIKNPWHWLSVSGRVVDIQPDEDLAFIDRMSQVHRQDVRTPHGREIFTVAIDRVSSSAQWGKDAKATTIGIVGYSSAVQPRHPAHLVLVAALWNQVHVVVGDVEHVEAAGVGRVGVIDLSAPSRTEQTLTPGSSEGDRVLAVVVASPSFSPGLNLGRGSRS